MSDTVVAPVTRGRAASPRTVLIQAMLRDTAGEMTYATAAPLLKQQGYEVDANTFNVIKSTWKRKQNGEVAPKTQKVAKNTSLPEVTVTEAIAYVTEVGGLAKAEADVRRRLAMVKAFRKLCKQTQKLAA